MHDLTPTERQFVDRVALDLHAAGVTIDDLTPDRIAAALAARIERDWNVCNTILDLIRASSGLTPSMTRDEAEHAEALRRRRTHTPTGGT